MKMIPFVLLLTLFTFVYVNGTINLTYILTIDVNKTQPSCIAEEFERYDAVGWVYPIPATDQWIPNITTKFIPSIENDYNCKFSKNDICNKKWTIRDWNIDESSIKTLDFIADRRWEDLPTLFISNTTKDFEKRIEVNNIFSTGISIRAGGVVELLICSGWNPHNYPCYYLNIDNREIYLSKYLMLPTNVSDFKSSYLEHYKAYAKILSQDEWRNFIISFDEKSLKLFDVNLNRTVIEHADKEPIVPMYLLMRSSNESLWKIHENHFLYTNTTQVSRLGPQLSISNKDLCVSLYVTTCATCEMIFFYQNNTYRKILKHVGPMQNNEWAEIKLKQENIKLDKLSLFVETKLLDGEVNKTNGFWAIDDIRICNENEVKVSYLNLSNSTIKENEVLGHVSCQLIRKPMWRPVKIIFNKIKDFPAVEVTSNSSAIKLSWRQEDPANQITYLILYQANDICTSENPNLRRLKSNGFLTTKHSEVVIDNLVPFTMYNITISTVVHEKDKYLFMNTLETVEPTFEELPRKIQIRALDTMVYVSWEKINCEYTYGRLIHTLIIANENLNFSKTLSLVTENDYKIEGLQPYTPYTLKILTARNGRNIEKGIYTNSIVLNFITLAGVAPSVENLEVYSLDQSSASLRYDLPKDPKGVPKEVQISKCNPLSFHKCKPYIALIKSCPIWPNKFCIFINNLMPYQNYSFRVRLKNRNNANFGKETAVSAYTMDQVKFTTFQVHKDLEFDKGRYRILLLASFFQRQPSFVKLYWVPGTPQNITYKIVDCHISTDYCHLNITWKHPYFENGTITSFNIILNSTTKHINTEETNYIHEVYKVENKSYFPEYTYQIKFIPYSTNYYLYLQSANTMYKSNFSILNIWTDNIGDHIDQSPKLIGKSDSTLLFKVPHLDRRLKFYTLTVVVQDFDRNRDIGVELQKNKRILNNVCHKYGDTWISQILKVENNNTETIMIGNSDKGKIKPKTKYCITFIITNKYRESEHDVVYYEKLETSDISHTKEATSSSYNHLYILLLLLLLIPISFLIYRYLRKRHIIAKPTENNENVYESMPFNEDLSNCVNNDNYDRLLHK